MTKSNEPNYTVRPAKHIERKVICEMVHRMRSVYHIENYQYAAMTSFYFVDCELFHRELNIQDMVCLEFDKEQKQRFAFNAPYFGIKYEWGDANHVIYKENSSISWKTKPLFMWLDYTQQISDISVGAAQHFIKSAKPNSLIFITLELCKKGKSGLPDVRNAFVEIGNCGLLDNIPHSFRKEPKDKFELAKIVARIYDAAIDDALTYREAEGRYKFHRLINCIYADGCPMMTIGGILLKSDTSVEGCHFENMAYACIDGMQFSNNPVQEIIAPKLTLKEVKELNSMFPRKSLKSVQKRLPFIPRSDIESFGKVYRYFATYTAMP